MSSRSPLVAARPRRPTAGPCAAPTTATGAAHEDDAAAGAADAGTTVGASTLLGHADADLHVNHGSALFYLDQIQPALDHYGQAHKLDPSLAMLTDGRIGQVLHRPRQRRQTSKSDMIDPTKYNLNFSGLKGAIAKERRNRPKRRRGGATNA